MARVLLDIELVRRKITGIGPLRREKWVSEVFSTVVKVGEEVQLAPDLFIAVQQGPNGIGISGRLKGVRCVFGDISNGSRSANLAAHSVATRRLSGRAELADG